MHLRKEEEGGSREERETEVDGKENKRKRKGARCAKAYAREVDAYLFYEYLLWRKVETRQSDWI